MKDSAVAATILASCFLAAGSGSAVTSKAVSGSLALATGNSIPGPGLYRLDLGSRHLTRLTRGRDGWPAWSRDGKRIAFIRRRNGGRLFIVNSDGSGRHAVGNVTATSAGWGPGDKHIVIANGKGIWVVRPDGTGLKRLYSSGGAAVDQPAWSPNGQTILFSRAGRGIVAMRVDGGGAHTIVKQPKPSRRHLYSPSAPAWAPNGKQISFVQTDFDALTGGPFIKTAKPDGSRQRTVARSSLPGYLAMPTWSPDSSSITFADLRGKLAGVFAVPSSGGKPSLLYGGSSGTIWSQPSWRPAGA